MTIKNPQKPMGVTEAAEFLGYSKAYLYKLIHQGRVPYSKPQGGRVFFWQNDLVQFASRGRKAADYELKEQAEQLLTGQRS